MKRSKARKEPMEFPLLEVIAFPLDHDAISIVVAGDFEVTGDISISLGSTEASLTECKRLLEHVVNTIADQLFEMKRHESPPFVPTGKLIYPDEPTE